MVLYGPPLTTLTVTVSTYGLTDTSGTNKDKRGGNNTPITTNIKIIGKDIASLEDDGNN